MIERNVGETDRRVRAGLAVLLGLVAVGSVTSGGRTLGVLAAVGALGLGFNAAVGICGLNAALGIDTTEN